MKLYEAIDRMVSNYPEFGTANGAVGRCSFASLDFLTLFPKATLLHLRGVKHERRNRCRWLKGLPNPDPNFYHCVVEYDGLVIDFTAKQLDRSAPYPLIMTKKECRRHWRHMTQRYKR